MLLTFEFENKQYQVHRFFRDDKLWYGAFDVANIFGIDDAERLILKFAIEHCELNGMIVMTYSGICVFAMQSVSHIVKPFQEWLIKTIDDKEKHDWEKRMERNIKHKSFLDLYDREYVIYVGFIKMIDDKMLIKLGHTKNIKTTFLQRHIADYGNIEAVHAQKCQLNEQFEKFLLKHETIKQWQYKEPVKQGGGRSIEVFLVTDDEFQILLQIIKENSHQFKVLTVDPNTLNVIQDTSMIESLNRRIETLEEQLCLSSKPASKQKLKQTFKLVTVSKKPVTPITRPVKKTENENKITKEHVQALIKRHGDSLNCLNCGKKFKTKQKLIEHLNRKNPCDRVCRFCGKKYKNQRSFHQHRKTHLAQDSTTEE